MKFFVGVTDNRWFEYLAERRPDEVNFWRPRSTFAFHAIQTGEPFLFKLHAPYNYVVGGGFFVRHSVLPVSLAWQAFEQKNGTPDVATLRQRVVELGHRSERDPQIGCTILAEPFFFNRAEWIPVPPDWSTNIVVGKSYDARSGVGAALWAQVQERIGVRAVVAPEVAVVAEGPRYGEEYLTRARLGQGTFRILVTEAYQRRCAVTGEPILPVLEAGHIKPYAEGGPNLVSNGLLLRSDLHTLFDRGYVTITSEFRVDVSRRIRDEFHNGEEYYRMRGQLLRVLPRKEVERPSAEFIKWHNRERFAS